MTGRLAAAVLGLLALTACAAPSTGVAAAPTPTAYAEPVSQPWPIAAVARTADPRVVRVTLTGLPAETAPGDCHTDVAYQVNEQPLGIGVGVSVSSRLPPPFAGCTTGERLLPVRLRQPLARRDVVASDRVSPEGGRFTAQGEGYVECRPPDCDPVREPVVPDCAHLRDAVSETDVPAHFRLQGPCRMPYAAVVVDLGAGACGVQEGPDPCAGKRFVRQFWHSDGRDWQLVLQGATATCADARRALAAFPVALCRDRAWVGAAGRG